MGARTPAARGRHWWLLPKHDDPERETAYTKGAEKALEAAAAGGWTVIRVKDDWTTVFTPT